MTGRKNPKTAEKEARLQEALTSVLNKEHTCHSAAIAFNVPHNTLYERIKGRLSRNKAQEVNQVLTHVEEKELTRWITRLIITEYPLDIQHYVKWQKKLQIDASNTSTTIQSSLSIINQSISNGFNDS